MLGAAFLCITSVGGRRFEGQECFLARLRRIGCPLSVAYADQRGVANWRWNYLLPQRRVCGFLGLGDAVLANLIEQRLCN